MFGERRGALAGFELPTMDKRVRQSGAARRDRLDAGGLWRRRSRSLWRGTGRRSLRAVSSGAPDHSLSIRVRWVMLYTAGDMGDTVAMIQRHPFVHPIPSD